MKHYAQGFILGFVVCCVAFLPFMLFHGLAIGEALGVAAALSALGLTGLWRFRWTPGVEKEREKEWAFVFVTFPTIFALIMQALIWSYFLFKDTGRIAPAQTAHWIAIFAAVIAFVVWVWVAGVLYRKSRANQLVQAMPVDAPSSREVSRARTHPVWHA